MRKALCFMLLGLAAAAIWADASSAGILGRRRPRPCPPAAPAMAETAPPPLAAELPEPFTSPKGTVYQLLRTTERGEQFDRPASLSATEKAGGGDDFNGTNRAAAKTSVSGNPPVRFSSLDQLLDQLPTDAEMRNHQPPISQEPNSRRVAEEDRNITVRAWLYAMKKEGDNDYHLIIGTDPQIVNIRYMTAEISGLPKDQEIRQRLSIPRQAFKDFLNEKHKIVGENFVRINPPVQVEITGSMFFDIHHPIGEVGVKSAPKRIPESVWEIHPVTGISFEP